MVAAFKASITADAVKEKARDLGADLVGIADGAAMDAHPWDPLDPRGPKEITDLDGARDIVMAKRLSAGVSRIVSWSDRHKYYNDELTLTLLEETSLEMVYWLEGQGYPALAVPPTHVDPWRYGGDPRTPMSTLLSLPHAAVEAGLGTLGLNLQLLTPEYGPRVLLTAVLASIPVDCDRPASGPLAVSRSGVRALPEGVPGGCGPPLGPRLAGMQRLSLALWLRGADLSRRAHRRRPERPGEEGAAALRDELQPVAEHPARGRGHRGLPTLRRCLPGWSGLRRDAGGCARGDPREHAGEDRAPRANCRAGSGERRWRGLRRAAAVDRANAVALGNPRRDDLPQHRDQSLPKGDD